MADDGTEMGDIGSERAKRAIAYGDKLAAIVNRTTDEDFDAVLPMIDPDRFVRRGNERDEPMDWPAYRKLLDRWKEGSRLYEMRLHRVSEAGNLIYLDVDERSVSAKGTESTLRSISVYEFDEADRIVAVDVCMGVHRRP